MKEQLIEFETARLAKEKGFNVPVNGVYYYENDELNIHHLENYNKYKDDDYNPCSAPTQSLLQKWLEEECGLYLQPEYAVDRHFDRVVIVSILRLINIGTEEETFSYLATYTYPLKEWKERILLETLKLT